MNAENRQTIIEALERERDRWAEDDGDSGDIVKGIIASIDSAIAALSESGEWEPLGDGTYHTDGPEIFKVEDGRITLYYGGEGSYFVDLQQGQYICRYVAGVEAQPANQDATP